MKAGQSDGWDIRMRCQLLNSPDLNVLDLGFFTSIQTIQYREEIYKIKHLTTSVENAYDALGCKTLDNVILNLQKVFEYCLAHHGGNDYTFPHAGKEKLQRSQALPTCFTCDEEAYLAGVESNVNAYLAAVESN